MDNEEEAVAVIIHLLTRIAASLEIIADNTTPPPIEISREEWEPTAHEYQINDSE